MNRLLALLTGACLVIVPEVCPADVIEVEIEVPTPDLRQDMAGFTHVELDGYLPAGRPGEPALPVRAIKLLLPPGHRVEAVSIRPAEEMALPGSHVVAPRQRPWPLSWGTPPHTGPDRVVYGSDTVQPEHLAEAQAPQRLRGFNLLPVLIRPVSYRPRSGKLGYTPSLTVVVNTAPGRARTPQQAARYRGLAADFERVRREVVNPRMLDRYPVSAGSTRQNHRYVVVTTQAMASCSGANTLQTLLADKESRGISTHLETMESIRTSYGGTDDAEKVRNFIKDMYENHGTEFVLLAGDADLEEVGGETQAPLVPVRGLWGNIGYGDETNIPSDLYYGCLDGTFNQNGNSLWGEDDDGVDAYGEVVVGRAPVDNCTEVGHFVRKSLAYQAAGGTWLRNVYMVGEWLWDGELAFGKDYLVDVHYSSTTDGLDTKGFSESSFFQVDTLYDKDQTGSNCPGQPSPCWDQADIMAVLNANTHIVNHLGHSYTYYNMRLMSDDIDSGMNNPNPFFEYTQGCYPGAFDNRLDPQEGNQVFWQDSFAEHMLLDQYGAFAVVMNTRYGLGWYSNLFHRLFWDAAFRHGTVRLGEMHAYSREQLADYISDSGFRWIYYEVTLFGDPELAVHLSSSTTTPSIGLPEDDIWFLAIQGASNPPEQTLSVTNTGGGTLDWSVSSSQTWLAASPLSGTAPSEITLAADASGKAVGTYSASLTFTAPGADNAPQVKPVELYVIEVPSEVAPLMPSSPTVDGVMSAGEYSGASQLDMDPGNPGTSTAHILHDGTRLYMALEIGADTDVDPDDVVVMMIDNDDDDAWPSAPGDEGHWEFYPAGGDYQVAFFPMYNEGSGVQYGDGEADPMGVAVAYGGAGPRVVEISFDLGTSHLQRAQGESFGTFLFYLDYLAAQEEHQTVANWPWALDTYDHTRFFGDVTVGTDGDYLITSPDALTFSSEQNGPPTAESSLTINCTSGAALGFSASSPQSWILLSKGSGTTPDVVGVRADPSALAPGNHSGSVRISAAGASNSPYDVPVTFQVAEQPPVFDIQPAALYFEAVQGSSVPGGQSIQITNAGGGSLSWHATKEGDWFALSDSSGSAPSSLTVVPLNTNFSEGFHSGRIVFSAPGAEPVELALTYKITLPPSIVVVPDTISHQSALAAGPAEVEIQIRNARNAPMEWHMGESVSWIAANPTSGMTIPSSPSRVILTLDPAGLSAGTHQAEITVIAPGANNTPLAVPVSWILEDVPAIEVAPASLTFNAVEGGNNPAPRTLDITNAGPGALSWTAAGNQAWLSCSPASGSAPGQVSVSVQAGGLGEGVYNGAITIASPEASNSPVEVPVQLVVARAGQPVIAVTPASLRFETTEGGQTPPSQTLSITNAGEGALDWSTACGRQWLDCTPVSGTAPGSVTVSVAPASLSAGSYEGTVLIESAQAANSPVAVPVTLVVQSGAVNRPPPVPVLVSPADRSDIDSPNPDLTVRNVVDPDGDGVTYTFEVYAMGAAAPYTVIAGVAEGQGGMTYARVEQTLDFEATYQWRARAVDARNNASDWSEKWMFNVHEPKDGGGGCGCTTDDGGPAGGTLLFMLLALALLRRRP